MLDAEKKDASGKKRVDRIEDGRKYSFYAGIGGKDVIGQRGACIVCLRLAVTSRVMSRDWIQAWNRVT